MLPQEKSNRRLFDRCDATFGKEGRPRPQAVATDAEDVRNYIAALAAQLAEMAYRSRLDGLASACDVVREVAEGNVASRARPVENRGDDAVGVEAGERDFSGQRTGR